MAARGAGWLAPVGGLSHYAMIQGVSRDAKPDALHASAEFHRSRDTEGIQPGSRTEKNSLGQADVMARRIGLVL